MFKNKSKRILKQLVANTNWNEISKKKLSIQFIEQFAEYLNWNDLIRYNKFEEPFIRKHINRFNMYELACNQHLSETFIREYADDENFLKGAIAHQTYTVNFAREHMKQFSEYLHKDFFRENTLPQEKYFEEFKGFINWWYLNKNSKLTKQFIEKYFEKFNFSSYDIDFYHIDKEHYNKIREGGWAKKQKYGIVAGNGIQYVNNAHSIILEPQFTYIDPFKEDV